MADHMIRALGLDGRARAIAAVTTTAVEELRRIHRPSPVAAAALGRIATGALLLASTLEKPTGREPILTLEVTGSGAIGRLVATASPRGWFRAMAANPGAEAPARPDGRPDVAAVVGLPGELVVTRDVGIGLPYRGVVPLVSGEIATDLAHYLTDSEQSPAAVGLGVRLDDAGAVAHAGGFTIQLLPGVSEEEAEALTASVRSLGAVTGRLAEGGGPDVWLAHLFPEGCVVLDRQPVSFLCGCSRQRVEDALRLLGLREVVQLRASAGGDPVELTCGFCQTAYHVSPGRLGQIVDELAFRRTGKG